MCSSQHWNIPAYVIYAPDILFPFVLLYHEFLIPSRSGYPLCSTKREKHHCHIRQHTTSQAPHHDQ